MSVNKTDTKLRNDRKNTVARDDFLVNRLMFLVVAATALIVILLLLRKNNSSFEAQFIGNVLDYIRLGTGLLFAAAVIYFIVKRIQHADESMIFFGSPILLGTASVLFGIAVMFTWLLVIGTVIFIISALILYFIFCFYQRDFFWISITAAAGSLFIYAGTFGVTAGLLKNIFKAAFKYSAVILPLIFIIGMILLRRAGGCVIINGKKVRLMKPEYKYYPFFVILAMTLIGSVSTMLLPAAMIYSVAALLAVYLVIAIVYTVKMI